MDTHTQGGPSLFRVSVAALIIFIVVSLAYRAFSQEDQATTDDTRRPQRVQIVQDNDVFLGEGDVRFGVMLEPGGGAVIANWRNHQAVYLDDQGRARELGIRLRHRHTGLSIPPKGIIVIEDQQGDYYAITWDGKLLPVPGIR